jgi:hypothetical protein
MPRYFLYDHLLNSTSVLLVQIASNSHHMKQLRWCETTPRSWSVRAHQASAANNLAIFFMMPWRWGKIHRNRDRTWVFWTTAPFSWGWNELKMTNIHGIWNHNGIRWIYNQDNLDFLNEFFTASAKDGCFLELQRTCGVLFSQPQKGTGTHKNRTATMAVVRARREWRPSRLRFCQNQQRLSEKGCCTYTDRS